MTWGEVRAGWVRLKEGPAVRVLERRVWNSGSRGTGQYDLMLVIGGYLVMARRNLRFYGKLKLAPVPAQHRHAGLRDLQCNRGGILRRWVGEPGMAGPVWGNGTLTAVAMKQCFYICEFHACIIFQVGVPFFRWILP